MQYSAFYIYYTYVLYVILFIAVIVYIAVSISTFYAIMHNAVKENEYLRNPNVVLCKIVKYTVRTPIIHVLVRLIGLC